MTGQSLRLVLGSGSPRRLELLGRLGLAVDVIVPGADETPLRGEPPPLHALRVARLKARSVGCRFNDRPFSRPTPSSRSERSRTESRGTAAEAISMLTGLAG